MAAGCSMCRGALQKGLLPGTGSGCCPQEGSAPLGRPCSGWTRIDAVGWGRGRAELRDQAQISSVQRSGQALGGL